MLSIVAIFVVFTMFPDLFSPDTTPIESDEQHDPVEFIDWEHNAAIETDNF